ncbi:MAG: DUF4232 domain-containing protein [Actinomycetota bacterium]
MRDELQELLQRRADGVPPHPEVPRSLAGRARRRVALNALGVGMVVLVMAGGAFAGLRAIDAAGPSQPAHPGQPTAPTVGPTGPSGQPTPSAGSISACTSAQLRAVGTFEGAAGSREGGVSLTNLSDGTCTLQGTPTITLLDQNLQPITIGVTFSSSPPGWSVYASPTPAGWPVVTVHPGDSAFVRLRWSNWCPDGRAAPPWRMDVPGGGAVDVNGLDAPGPPPCNGQGMPSTIEVGPFEPGPGA